MNKSTTAMTIEERLEEYDKNLKIARAMATLIDDIKSGIRWTMDHDEDTDTWVAPSEDSYAYSEYMARIKTIELIESELNRML